LSSTESESSLIARALELPPLERAEFVRRACREHPGLREKLHHVAAALVSGEPAGSASPAPSSDDERARALELALLPREGSATLGPYKLLQKIGEGGFGIVWMAEQQTPVRRRVAVKILKGSVETREVIARFEAERQALALMDHPNIARVFDGGETDDGRPFVVMELVRGVPITSYCDEQRLPPEARLRLFVTVCQAVQHAHQKGVIHRDLKPSNIIVSLHDGTPVPKIIDFGIAKATEARLTDKTLFTHFHAFIGTPAYTSPEQLEMGGLDVDTRSDIYSLGVLLYELLTGRPPFDPEELKKSSLEEMRRIVREVDPPRPSHFVGTMIAERRDTVARQRGTEPQRLSLHLRGELDWIVLRCLEKDRTRRYATAQDLAADVQRHLRDEPVLARPPSPAYRLRKFVRRHKFGFAAGAVSAAALIATFVAVSLSLVRERRATTKTAHVVQLMNDMLGSVGPNVALRAIADSTTLRLATDLRDQPDVAADLRDTLGGVYIGLGEKELAERLLRQAAEMHRAAAGAESAATANSLHLLGVALRGRNRALEPEAESSLQQALAIRQKLFGPDHPLVADTLFELAFVRGPRRSTADMRTMLERVRAIRERAFGAEHPKVAQAIAGLGTVAQMEFNHNEGARWHAAALAMRRRLLGDVHLEVADSLVALGQCYLPELDHRDDARDAFNQAFALRRKLLGDAHPKVIVPFLGLVGQLSARTTSPEQLAALREFVASERRVLPRDSILLAPSLLALASLEPDGVDSAAARALVQEARALIEASRAHGASLDDDIVQAMMFFSWSKLVGNVPAEGVIMAEEGVKLAHATFGTEDEGELPPTHTLAWIELALGRKAAAVPTFETAVRLLSGRHGYEEGIAMMDQAALAECYRATGRVAAARELLEPVLAAQRRRGAPRSGTISMIGFVSAELGITLEREGRHVEAEPILRQALADYDGIRPLGRRLRPSQRALSSLGLALAGQGRFVEAEPMVTRAFEELQANEARLAGDRAGMLREAFDAVIAVYRAWNRPDKVAEWMAKAP
jgi:serine/threonine protein kinase/tetratricopeptide (TPR) repeat protein